MKAVLRLLNQGPATYGSCYLMLSLNPVFDSGVFLLAVVAVSHELQLLNIAE